MKQYPEIPRAEEAPDLFEGGHLWLQEKIDGAHLRFQLRESGLLRFGDRTRVFGEEVPGPYRHAARHVRENLDRAALREAVSEPEGFVFFGEATHAHRIEYDWDRMPSFLGFDVWSARKEAFLPPDAVEKIHRRLGLHPVDTFEKEVRATDFDPGSYEIPTSEWYDGPAAGVVVRNKTGGRAQIPNPAVPDADGADPVDTAETDPIDADPDALAEEYATDERFEAVASALRESDRPVTFDAVYDRVVERIFREEHARLFEDRADLDVRAFKSAVAARTQEYLGG
ncbi:RNA ligase family protein [Halorussus salilacus]|uniref:RNA ligase family protein n=1 Tax=Halorussus salilacus TaxID=2953750 RepID=UPI00209F3A84|nr:RNA ligase family protein [Halorussus salilacus]USZ67874.1 RNA ligase family protein [Halorussus salilacus]